MIFKCDRQSNYLVWDSATKKLLAKFKDGYFETEDASVIKKLKEKGFKVVEINSKSGSDSDDDSSGSGRSPSDRQAPITPRHRQ